MLEVTSIDVVPVGTYESHGQFDKNDSVLPGYRNQTVRYVHDYVQNQERHIRIKLNTDTGDTCIEIMEAATRQIVRQISLADVTVALRRYA